jgi:hypothetical protein
MGQPRPALCATLPKLGEGNWTAHISGNDGVVDECVDNPALPSPNLGREKLIRG